jgi:hypothetical protein
MALKDYAVKDHTFKQGDVLDAIKLLDPKQDSAIRGGFCFMASINWIHRVREGKTPEEATKWFDPKQKALMKQIGGQFSAYTAIFEDGKDKPEAVIWVNEKTHADKITSLFQLSSPANLKKGKPTAWEVGKDDLLKTIQTVAKGAGAGTVFKVGFGFKEGGGHACALAITDGAAYFFDPNFGLFKIDGGVGDAKMKSFVADLKADYAKGKLTVSTSNAFKVQE